MLTNQISFDDRYGPVPTPQQWAWDWLWSIDLRAVTGGPVQDESRLVQGSTLPGPIIHTEGDWPVGEIRLWLRGHEVRIVRTVAGCKLARVCGECGSRVHDTPSGTVCLNQHGGAPVIEVPVVTPEGINAMIEDYPAAAQWRAYLIGDAR